ncbi:hypothetical protein AVEN_249052-1, partial [Araneus ventricosus]
PATIFYEDEENVDTDIRSLKKKNELLDYNKSRLQEIAEDDAFEELHCNDKALTMYQLADAEICSMVHREKLSSSISLWYGVDELQSFGIRERRNTSGR